ncbi:MAG: cbb3-type cytochrome c oxidase N-terminal domain-containing protein [Bacteroidota bacterium]
MKNKAKKLIAGLGMGVLTTTFTFAQSEALAAAIQQDEQARSFIFLLIVVAIIIALMTLVLAATMFVLVKARAKEARVVEVAAAKAAGLEVVEPTGPPAYSWKWVMNKLTDYVPIEKEADIDMGHEYDGIRELDNNLPPWWKYGFYVSIVFAFIYMWYFHFSDNDWSSVKEWEAEMAQAEVEREAYLAKMGDMIDETNVIMADEAGIADGQTIYMEKCVACHGAMGEGGVGPNLTDDYWLHGGDIKEVFATIKYGVPAKGMIPWEAELRPPQLQAVASYIKTLYGTNPPNAKEPQGELYAPEGEGGGEEAAPADSTAAPADETVAMAQ